MKRDGVGGGQAIVLVVLAAGAAYCGVDAIVSDTATTPSRFGQGKPVHGTDTVLVGVGWLLVAGAFIARIVCARLGGRIATAVAVGVAVVGAGFWFAAL